MNAPANPTTFGQALQAFDGQVSRISAQLMQALPSHINIDKFQRTLMAAVKADPDLLRADRQSLINAIEKCALDGLLPDKREAALVVFKRSYKDGDGQWHQALEVTYMPMVFGLRKKILQSGEIADIFATVVYRREVEEGAFLYEEGSERMLRHRPLLDLTGEDCTDDKIVAAYSMATYKDGSKSYEVMRRFQIDHVRESSQTGATKDKKGQPRKPSGPWVDHFAEQAKKTVVRRHSKMLPMSGDIVDVEGRELESARSAATLLAAVIPDAPVALPGRAEDAGEEAEDGPVIDQSTGMTEVDEETARRLDAGEPATDEGHDPETGEVAEPDQDEGKPVWQGYYDDIVASFKAAQTRDDLRGADEKLVRALAGFPGEVQQELEVLASQTRKRITKPQQA